MIKSFDKINKVKGELELPGDKSISHRAIIFSSLAEGHSRIFNLSNGEDIKSTINCFRQMGVDINKRGNSVFVKGNGFKGFNKPVNPLNAGNSGTAARLLSGILVAQNFESVIVGDESLSKRPMKRIIDPLAKMGGQFETNENFTLPIKIIPAKAINQIDYELPVASAQVKSAIILAGLHSEKISSVKENSISRDHTERLLELKSSVKKDFKYIFFSNEDYPRPKTYFIPGDISTASFFIILTLLSADSELKINNISLNKTRTGYLDILKEMGGNFQVENEKIMSGENFGDLIVKSSKLKNIKILQSIIPNIIDEIPILSVAGLFASGDFEINGASELRKKESDRIKSLCENYKKLGIKVEEFENGFRLSGKIKNLTPSFNSFRDHRIAMTFAILSMLLKNGGKVNDFDCVKISNPEFTDQINKIIQ